MAQISVFVRMRPLIEQENLQGYDKKVELNVTKKEVKVNIHEDRQKIFKFDEIFTQKSSQTDIFDQTHMNSLVERVVQGFHSTIFAYGQTGSGKTYTIEGESNIHDDNGIIPRSIQTLFEHLSYKNHNKRQYKVFLSFLQIYNEGIYDLLDTNDGKPLKMRWNKYQQFIVNNLFQGHCRSATEAIRWWKKGQKNKILGSHKMNTVSSRSHCILTMKVHSYDIQDPSDKIESKLQIIDLAGSQRYRCTKSTGIVFKEGIQINKSLFTLRQVISSLYQTSKNKNNKSVPPYRDSKLTSLLKQSIGGNAYCAMIACLNPTSSHFQETLQTLTYASMASYISNQPIRNIDPKIKENQILKEQNWQLRNQITKMAAHIDYLTNLLQSSKCESCDKKKTIGRVLTEQLQVDRQTKNRNQTNEKLPHFELNQQLEYKSKLNAAKTAFEINQKDKTTKSNGTQQRLTSTRQVLQSIHMIKDLIHANSTLCEKMKQMKISLDKQQKEIFALVQENQVLRNRWEMMQGNLIEQLPQNDRQSQAPVALYERMLRKQKGQGLRINKNTISKQKPLNILNNDHSYRNYNNFLENKKKKKKQQLLNSRKKYPSINGNNNKYHSFIN